ncbi:methyltransferase domain-containing protein [Portibacter lacus]|uniref:SAM-dependent methyltransferase n=1 Tax=Portibacter lacus TaxID=1099794 RepID=A0AA37SPK4_9BACT|nr:methyltransferase domain-containing protein [Portibacter lacus]GLR18316.1 SAM-dependent methyltransferase [Portibacter lacus]
MIDKSDGQFWTDRYLTGSTGWDIGAASTPLVKYFDQLDNKDSRILIPGAGNAHEAEYLFKKGFTNVHVLDISEQPLASLKKRVPEFPTDHLINADFFKHEGKYDLIIEQTFFCSFEPSLENRSKYAQKMYDLLDLGGKLIGLWFKHLLIKEGGSRPFGGSKEEYLGYLDPYFDVIVFDDCYNSIKPRLGNELFGIFSKKK